MKLVRDILGSSGGKFVLALLLVWLLFSGWTALAAPGKIDPGVESAANRGRVDISVELNFAPERFHILEMQQYGRLVGTSENSIQLRRVFLEDVHKIARLYWVKSIRPFVR